ncbi:MAG: septum formation protein Maf [Clostridia bacterium]|nr:septum formation protein Maf [Clostridia bacterium]
MSDYRFHLLQGASLILASASPRRRELLSAMGLTFSVCPCDVDESVPQGMHPAEAVVLLARRKAEAVAALHPDAIILASDTLVEIDALPLGKPQDKGDAVRTLMRLSGNEHRVHSGVAVIYRGRALAEKDTTRVFMRPFDEEEARAYVQTGEPMDKAGAYGIQGLGGRLVDRIEGCYDTVVGLPTRLVDDMLCRLVEIS